MHPPQADKNRQPTSDDVGSEKPEYVPDEDPPPDTYIIDFSF